MTSDKKALALQSLCRSIKKLASAGATDPIISSHLRLPLACPKWSCAVESCLEKLSIKDIEELETLIETMRGKINCNSTADLPS